MTCGVASSRVRPDHQWSLTEVQRSKHRSNEEARYTRARSHDQIELYSIIRAHLNGGDRRSVYTDTDTDAPEVSDTSRYESIVGSRDDVKELLSTLCRVKVPLDVHNPDGPDYDTGSGQTCVRPGCILMRNRICGWNLRSLGDDGQSQFSCVDHAFQE